MPKIQRSGWFDIYIATSQLSEMAKKETLMSRKDLTVLESLKLAEDLLEVTKKHQKYQKIEKEVNRPPKWLLGRETLYQPIEDS